MWYASCNKMNVADLNIEIQHTKAVDFTGFLMQNSLLLTLVFLSIDLCFFSVAYFSYINAQINGFHTNKIRSQLSTIHFLLVIHFLSYIYVLTTVVLAKCRIGIFSTNRTSVL